MNVLVKALGEFFDLVKDFDIFAKLITRISWQISLMRSQEPLTNTL